MADPRRLREPRNYFSRREQWRLLTLVMSLGLVLFLMNEARKPKYWYWLVPKPSAESQPTPPNAVADGALRAEEPITQSSPAPNPKKNVENPPVGSPEIKAPDQAETPSMADTISDEGTSGDYFPGVDPRLLETIRENTRFRDEEQDAWFHLLAILKKADPAELRARSIGRITRLQLAEQSKAYRGELVTIQGTIRRAHRLAAPENIYGIDAYWQLWVFPEDSPARPIVVYCLDWPKDVPHGMEIDQPAVMTGFHFKQWLHEAQGGPQLAPVVLVRDFERVEPPSISAEHLDLGPWHWAAMAAGAALAAAGFVTYVYRRTRPGRRG